MFVSLGYFDSQADALFMVLPPELGLHPSTPAVREHLFSVSSGKILGLL